MKCDNCEKEFEDGELTRECNECYVLGRMNRKEELIDEARENGKLRERKRILEIIDKRLFEVKEFEGLAEAYFKRQQRELEALKERIRNNKNE